jgi:nucleotide-binding universal stress UspA family protein
MFKHILIPTDGSDLSKKAIRYGIELAKACNAKVTGITVTTPFHVFATDPETITDTPDAYRKRTSAAATKYLTQLKDAAAAVGVTCAASMPSTSTLTAPSLMLRTRTAVI